MNHADSKAIIIFTKFPEEGKVKTRLAKTTGTKFATCFYKSCAEYTFSEVSKVKGNNIFKYLYFTDKNNTAKIKSWIGDKFIFEVQKGKELGIRMQNAFQNSFTNGSKKTIIIGTDLPDISSEIINNAFQSLNNYQSVIGPSSDGGYYLLGLKDLHKDIFNNIEWSSDTVFSDTCKKLKENSITIKLLPELIDIDTVEDLKIWFNKENSKFHPIKPALSDFFKK